jgi:hypothetical protein
MLVTHGRALIVAVRHPNGGGDMEGSIFMMVDLGEEDAASVRGGNPIQIAAMLTAAFGAGFNFGYFELAPRLFDESGSSTFLFNEAFSWTCCSCS